MHGAASDRRGPAHARVRAATPRLVAVLLMLAAVLAARGAPADAQVGSLPECAGDESVMIAPAQPVVGGPLIVAGISRAPHAVGMLAGPDGVFEVSRQEVGALGIWQRTLIAEAPGPLTFTFEVGEDPDLTVPCATATVTIAEVGPMGHTASPGVPDGAGGSPAAGTGRSAAPGTTGDTPPLVAGLPGGAIFGGSIAGSPAGSPAAAAEQAARDALLDALLEASARADEPPAPTRTPRPTRTPGPTSTPRPTRTPTPIREPTLTREPTATRTPRPTNEPTDTPVPTHTRTPSPTRTPRPTNEPTATRTPRPTSEPTDTPVPTHTRTPRPTSEPTETPEPTATRTPSPTRTPRPDPTDTPVPTDTPIPTPTPTLTPPIIAGIEPPSAVCRQALTIRGRSFGDNRSAVRGKVWIAGVEAWIVHWSDAEIQVRVPATSPPGNDRRIEVNIAGQATSMVVRVSC